MCLSINMPSKTRSEVTSSDASDIYSMRFAPVPYIRMILIFETSKIKMIIFDYSN